MKTGQCDPDGSIDLGGLIPKHLVTRRYYNNVFGISVVYRLITLYIPTGYLTTLLLLLSLLMLSISADL